MKFRNPFGALKDTPLVNALKVAGIATAITILAIAAIGGGAFGLASIIVLAVDNGNPAWLLLFIPAVFIMFLVGTLIEEGLK